MKDDKELYDKLEEQAKRYKLNQDNKFRAKIDMEVISLLHNMPMGEYAKYIDYYKNNRIK